MPAISIYTKKPEVSGPYYAATVGELKEILAKLPDDLPLSESYEVTWFNIGRTDAWSKESLGISPDYGDEEDDFDEDEEESSESPA